MVPARSIFLISTILFGTLLLPFASLRAESDIYVPTSGWLVGPAQMGGGEAAKPGTMPCVMANQFNNGFVFRFSGGGQQILAAAVDFRQRVFTPGQRYDIGFIFGEDAHFAISGEAYDEATLIVNAQRQERFYEALQQARVMRLAISGKQMEFAMLGIRDGLSRMENCYQPTATQQQVPLTAGVRSIGATGAQGSLPQIGARKAGHHEQAQAQAAPPRGGGSMSFMQPGTNLPDSMPVTHNPQAAVDPAPDSALPQVPAAASGVTEAGGAGAPGIESLFDSILGRAAQQVATLQPEAGDAALTASPQRARADAGAAQPATTPFVSTGVPLARNWAQPGNNVAGQAVPAQSQQQQQQQVATAPAGAFALPFGLQRPQPQGPQHAVPRPYPGTAPSPAPAAAQAAPAEQKWQALKGASLRETLDNWTRTAQVRLIWAAAQEFPVKDSVSIRGSLETGVLNLLNLYARDSQKPVGRVYYDPATGQKVLLIEDAGV